MKNVKKINDKRLVLLQALIHHADLSGSDDPHCYKDELLKTLDVCEHVFNVMLRQLGDRYCRREVCFEENRSRFAINLRACLALRTQLTEEKTRQRQVRQGVRNTLLAASFGTFLVLLVMV